MKNKIVSICELLFKLKKRSLQILIFSALIIFGICLSFYLLSKYYSSYYIYWCYLLLIILMIDQVLSTFINKDNSIGNIKRCKMKPLGKATLKKEDNES